MFGLVLLCTISFIILIGWNFGAVQPLTKGDREDAFVVVLEWTPVSQEPTHFVHCPNSDKKCLFTQNRTFLNDSDAILFREARFERQDLPQHRRQEQYFAIMSWECPLYLKHTTINLEKNYFNLTITYRRDSDIFSPYFITEENTNSYEMNEDYLIDVVRRKTKLVAWFVNNCESVSKREKYVDVLQKYIPIDIYGRCGPFVCDIQENKCTEMLRRDYKFYLAFEKAICTDYVTEKPLIALTNDVVPIVLSRSVAQTLLPNDSFIAVDDFASPRHLAEFLYQLSNDSSAYVQYLSYRRKHAFKKNAKIKTAICDLCEMILDEPDLMPRYTENFEQWFLDDSNCTTVDVDDEENDIVYDF